MQKDKQDKTIKDDKVYLFDKPENITLLMRVFYSICIILLVLDFVIDRHIYLDWEELPGFYGLYGFVACVLLVIIAKALRKVLMRKEDYYDVDE